MRSGQHETTGMRAELKRMNLRYFEDYELGEENTTGEHLVSAEEIVEFAERWDPQPFHTDPVKAERSVFRGLTASGAHTFAISVLLRHEFRPKPAIVASLGYDEIRFTKPVRPGDRLTFRSKCLEKRESRSNPDQGIIVFRAEVLNQHGQAVLTMKSVVMVARRPAA
jgi:acyl dehydratase